MFLMFGLFHTFSFSFGLVLHQKFHCLIADKLLHLLSFRRQYLLNIGIAALIDSIILKPAEIISYQMQRITALTPQ